MLVRPDLREAAPRGTRSGIDRGSGQGPTGPHHPLRHRATLATLLAALLLTVPVLAAGCGAADAGESPAGAELTVFAAAGLTEAFTEIGELYTAAHPGTTIRFNFAGAPTLVMQLRQGASADVVALADNANIEKVARLVGTPRVFARNKLAIIVEPGNPCAVTCLRDLADPELKVVLGEPTLPGGACADRILAAQGIGVEPVSLEDNIKGVVTKVAMGEADAGMAWVSELTEARGKIDGVVIPDDQNVIESFPIAVVGGTAQDGAAAAFVDLVFSAAGRRVLQANGFMPPE